MGLIETSNNFFCKRCGLEANFSDMKLISSDWYCSSCSGKIFLESKKEDSALACQKCKCYFPFTHMEYVNSLEDWFCKECVVTLKVTPLQPSWKDEPESKVEVFKSLGMKSPEGWIYQLTVMPDKTRIEFLTLEESTRKHLLIDSIEIPSSVDLEFLEKSIVVLKEIRSKVGKR